MLQKIGRRGGGTQKDTLCSLFSPPTIRAFRSVPYGVGLSSNSSSLSQFWCAFVPVKEAKGEYGNSAVDMGPCFAGLALLLQEPCFAGLALLGDDCNWV